MDWASIAGVAAGISGGLGLLGFIIYAVLHLNAKPFYLTPALIEALKGEGVDPEKVKGFSPQQLKEFVKAHTTIPKQIIDKIAAPEVRDSGNRILYVSIGLLIFALVLGIIVLRSPNEIGDRETPPSVVTVDVQGDVAGDIIIPARDYINIESISANDFFKRISDYEQRLNELTSKCDRETISRVKEMLSHAKTLANQQPPRWSDVLDKLTKVIETQCRDRDLTSQAYTMRGTAFYLSGGRSLLAIKDFSRVIKMADASEDQRAKALYNRGWLYGRLDPKRIDKAIMDYTAVIDMDYTPPEQRASALYNRGVIYDNLDPPLTKEAIADFTAVIDMDDATPKWIALTLVNRGLTYANLDPPRTKEANTDLKLAKEFGIPLN